MKGQISEKEYEQFISNFHPHQSNQIIVTTNFLKQECSVGCNEDKILQFNNKKKTYECVVECFFENQFMNLDTKQCVESIEQCSIQSYKNLSKRICSNNCTQVQKYLKDDIFLYKQDRLTGSIELGIDQCSNSHPQFSVCFTDTNQQQNECLKCPNSLQIGINRWADFYSNFGDQIYLIWAEYIGESLAKCPNITSLKIDLFYYFFRFDKDSTLNDMSINHIGKAIEKCSNLTSLFIDLYKGSKITSLSAQYLGETIVKFQNLNSLTLYLKSIVIGNLGVQYLMEAIIKRPNIISLDLNLEDTGISDLGVQYLGEAIIANRQKLTFLTLNLSQNKINHLGSQYLGQAISAISSTITSLTLILKYTYLNDSGIQQLRDAIIKCPNLTSVTLILWRNNISELGYQYLGEAIDVIASALTSLTLNLSFNQKMGVVFFQNLREALAKCQNLIFLQLEFCDNKIGDQGVQYLTEAIIKSPNITQLNINLNSCNISNLGAQYIGDVLAKLVKLTSLVLDFQYNEIINDLDIQYLVEAIIKLPSLQSLEIQLYDTNVSEKAIDNFKKQLKTKFQSIFLQINK